MVEIIPRSEWTDSAKGRTPRLRKGPITVHWAGPGPSSYIKADDPRAAFAETLRQEREAHMDPDGRLKASDIAYNYMIDYYGRIWEARGYERQSGANGPGNNRNSVAVQLAVGKADDPAPQAMFDALDDLHRWLVAKGVSTKDRRGHRDVRATECPGDWIYGRAVESWTMVRQVIDIPQKRFLYSQRARKPFWSVLSDGTVISRNGAPPVEGLNKLGVQPATPITGGVQLNRNWLLLTSFADGGTFQVRIAR